VSAIPTPNPMKIGLIGLGTMGAPMAGHLLKGGHQLFVYARNKLPEAIAHSTATQCLSPRGVAERADIIITVLPDTPDVEGVLFGADGVADGLKANNKRKLVIDMSSISPIATRNFARRIEALSCDYLDAPVSGGEVGAKAASLSIMVGGPQEVFDRVLPLLQLMGKNINRVGGHGDGQTAKVANQMIVAITIQAVAEALLFAAKAGADPERVQQALMGGFASSRVLDVHGPRMVQRTFEPGFRIALHQKDLNLALGAAESMGMKLPGTMQAQALFNACAAMGGQAWDHSALVKALEAQAHFEIGQASTPS
jgi:2-hydroxy-3-oxopropionate reductase